MPLIPSIILLAIATAVACALPGVFLVLRRQSMLVDAMSHAVLPGIVIGALVTGTTHSILLVIFAALLGLVVVIGANWLRGTGLISGDADQGLIFPVFFAVGVLILSTSLKNVHIHESTVLTGDLNLLALPSEHIIVGGIDIGPSAMWQLLGVVLLTALFILAAYPVLEASTFDRPFALAMGLPVKLVDTILMVITAIAVVTAFNTAGAILVVAMMVAPAAAAMLITRSLGQLIGLTLVFAVLSAVIGFLIAWQWDLATSPMMALIDGVAFLLAAAYYTMRRRRAVTQEKPA